MKRVRPALATLSLVVLVGVAGCTTQAATTTTATTTLPPVTTTTTAPAPTTTTAAPPTATTTTTSVAPAVLPDGFELVNAPKNQLNLAIPAGLTIVDTTQLANSPAMQAVIAEFAQELGMTVDSLNAVISGMDIMAMDKVGNNINVMLPINAKMPKLSDLQPTLDQVGASGITSRDATSPFGPALVVSYTSNVVGKTHNQTQVYALTAPLTVSVITITGASWTPEQLGQFADVLVANLQRA